MAVHPIVILSVIFVGIGIAGVVFLLRRAGAIAVLSQSASRKQAAASKLTAARSGSDTESNEMPPLVFSGLSKSEAEEFLDCVERYGYRAKCDVWPEDGTFTVRL